MISLTKILEVSSTQGNGYLCGIYGCQCYKYLDVSNSCLIQGYWISIVTMLPFIHPCKFSLKNKHFKAD